MRRLLVHRWPRRRGRSFTAEKRTHRCVPPGFPIDARRPVSFLFPLSSFHGLLSYTHTHTHTLSLSLSLSLSTGPDASAAQNTGARPHLRPPRQQPTAARNRIEGKLIVSLVYIVHASCLCVLFSICFPTLRRKSLDAARCLLTTSNFRDSL